MIWPGLRPASANSTGTVVPTFETLKARACRPSSACRAASRADFAASGTWSGSAEPGVPGRRPGRPADGSGRGLAVIGVDVLAQQRDLDGAGSHQLARLGQHRRSGSRIFRAARIGHDAEGAELVAAFLDGQECRTGAHIL